MTVNILETTGGLILAGGRSRRFGAEKAVALFRGRRIMDYVRAALSPCAAVAVSAGAGTGAATQAREWGLDIVADDPALAAGPLTGVAAGLAWAQARGFALLATAPCDAPLAPGDFVARLRAGVGDAAAAYVETADGAEPLFAVWRVSLLAPLRAALADGAHPAAHAFLDAQGARRVHFGEAGAFANINAPDDLSTLG